MFLCAYKKMNTVEYITELVKDKSPEEALAALAAAFPGQVVF